MTPPVALLALTASTAAQRSSFCRCELRRMSLVVRWIFTDWSREITPNPGIKPHDKLQTAMAKDWKRADVSLQQ